MKLVFIDNNFYWKGQQIIEKFYQVNSISNYIEIGQVQAVCLTKSNEFVMYKHIDGYIGLPGGKVEGQETLYAALKREIDEEISCNLLTAEPILLVESHKPSIPEKKTYSLRFWARVELIDKKVNDPAGKSLERINAKSIEEAISLLDWGERGAFLIQYAYERQKT